MLVLVLTKITEPSTATVFGQVADCTVEDFRKAIETAHAAQIRYFDETTAAQRGAFLRRWYETIMANVDDRKSRPSHTRKTSG